MKNIKYNMLINSYLHILYEDDFNWRHDKSIYHKSDMYLRTLQRLTIQLIKFS